MGQTSSQTLIRLLSLWEAACSSRGAYLAFYDALELGPTEGPELGHLQVRQTILWVEGDCDVMSRFGHLLPAGRYTPVAIHLCGLALRTDRASTGLPVYAGLSIQHF